MKSPIFNLAVLAGTLVFPLVSSANTVVAPNDAANNFGTYESSFVFSGNFQTHYQLQYANTEFGTSPLTITGISFRAGSTGTLGGDGLLDCQGFLSYATAPVSSYNVGAGGLLSGHVDSASQVEVLARGNRAVHQASLSAPDSTADAPFDLVLNFDRPFVYDPSKGDLVFDVKSYAYTGTSPAVDYYTQSAKVRQWKPSSIDGLGASATQQAPVVGFITAPVPEPAPFFALAFGLVPLVLRRRK